MKLLVLLLRYPLRIRFAESEHTTRAMMLDRNQVPFYTSLNL